MIKQISVRYCTICGRSFEAHNRVRKNVLAKAARPKNAVTCSKKCSHTYAYSVRRGR